MKARFACLGFVMHFAMLPFMNEMQVLEIARQMLLITMKVSAPILLVGLVVGVSIALLQALTQIQEMTLVFVPKIMAIFFALFLLLPWMMDSIVIFGQQLSDLMISGGFDPSNAPPQSQ